MQTSSPLNASYTFIRVALYAIVALIVLVRPLELYPDSLGYVEGWFNRPPVYPIVLDILEALFGKNYLIALKVFQLGLGLFGIHYFVASIRKITQLNTFYSSLLIVVLAIPYVYNQQIANMVLTEAIAYPLYLIIAVKSLAFFQYRNFKQVWHILGLMTLLLLVRKQFLFILPLVLAMIIWFGYQQKKYRKPALAIIAFVLLPLVVTLIDSTYHKIRHGHYVATPWTGIHLLAPAMYVADKEDVSIYSDPDQKQLFSEMFEIITKEELTLYSQPQVFQNRGIDHYIYSFSKIANRTIYTDGKVQFEKNLPVDEALIALNKTTIAMSLPLVKDNFTKWISIYIKNVMYGIGNAKMFLLFALIALIGLWNINKDTIIFKAMALFATFTISNIALIAIGMHTLKRFTFYNDWVLFLLLFLLIQRVSLLYNKTE